MPGRHHRRVEVLGAGQQVGELDGAVAGDTGDRRLATEIALDEFIDHRFPEAGFEVEHVMRNADRRGRPARIVDVLAGTAGTLAPDRLAMVVELQGDTHHVEARLLEERRGDG